MENINAINNKEDSLEIIHLFGKKIMQNIYKRKISKKKNLKNYKKIINNIKIYIYFILFISILLSLLLLLSFKFLNRNNKIKNKFYDIFPKTNLNNDKVSFNITDVFKARHLFISEDNLTNEYIRYIRPINEEEEKNYSQISNEDIQPEEFWNTKRPNQYSYEEYFKLNFEEKLINPEEKFEPTNDPLISVIVPSYNKENIIMKTIRSIQNQSLKNIEIIIIDDCSTDNSKEKFKILLETDQRIRMITHLKNMGLWKSTLHGFLYSRAKYLILFDMGDFYTDNYVLEDAYNLVQKYQLDSLKFGFLKTTSESRPYSYIDMKMTFPNELRKIFYGEKYFDVTTYMYGTIWNRLFRANVLMKGLYLLDHYILNAYKNLWEDRWYNTLINKVSKRNLMINRPGYLYIKTYGEGTLKPGDRAYNFKKIKEFINFWIFDLELLPKQDNKKSVIDNLRNFNKNNNRYFGVIMNLNYLIEKFEPYEHLLTVLIDDPFVKNEDKQFVKDLYNQYKQKFFK